jgi:hypothetical protein
MPTPSDKVPGPPCCICGEPTHGVWYGEDVYHALCLKKLFPKSTLHLERINDTPSEPRSICP